MIHQTLAGKNFNTDRLVHWLLGLDETSQGNRWRGRCVIDTKYAGLGGKNYPICVVYHDVTTDDGKVVRWYLRHSKGPHQGHGWDIYGDDYQSPELALLALSQAPPPHYVLAEGRL